MDKHGAEEKMLRAYAAERGISLDQARAELEEAIRIGEESYASKPREFWKHNYCQNNPPEDENKD